LLIAATSPSKTEIFGGLASSIRAQAGLVVGKEGNVKLKHPIWYLVTSVGRKGITKAWKKNEMEIWSLVGKWKGYWAYPFCFKFYRLAHTFTQRSNQNAIPPKVKYLWSLGELDRAPGVTDVLKYERISQWSNYKPLNFIAYPQHGLPKAGFEIREP